jgi:hypothetical protein
LNLPVSNGGGQMPNTSKTDGWGANAQWEK